MRVDLGCCSVGRRRGTWYSEAHGVAADGFAYQCVVPGSTCREHGTHVLLRPDPSSGTHVLLRPDPSSVVGYYE
jgi:hypothetical protein